MRYVSIALLLVASTLSAENWKQIAELDSKGGMLVFDAAGVDEVKGFRRAWFKSIYTTDQVVPEEYRGTAPAATHFRWVRSMSYFNCSERTSAPAGYRWFSVTDESVASFNPAPLTFRKVIPGSLDEQMLDAVCKADMPGPQAPSEEDAKMIRATKIQDYYPVDSIRRGERGSSWVQVCVGPDGNLLREPVVTESSGYRGLDRAAIKAAKAAKYAPGTKNGAVLDESCLKFRTTFDIRNP